MHKIIVQIADILFIVAGGITIMLGAYAYGPLGFAGGLLLVCVCFSVWSLLRVLQGELEKLNRS